MSFNVISKKSVLTAALLLVSSTVYGEQCKDNFSVEGSFFKGKTYTTEATISGVNVNRAYKKIYQLTVKEGWKILNADKEMGIISAAQDVSYGQGKTAPLNIVIEDLDKQSVQVSMTYTTSGGVTSPTDAVQDYFCKTIAAVK